MPSRSRAGTPLASSIASSSNSAEGDNTTPLPIRQRTPARRIPEGIRCSTVFLPSMTSVWPALWPPWKRTTALAWSVSRSTIFPFPSSPSTHGFLRQTYVPPVTSAIFDSCQRVRTLPTGRSMPIV